MSLNRAPLGDVPLLSPDLPEVRTTVGRLSQLARAYDFHLDTYVCFADTATRVSAIIRRDIARTFTITLPTKPVDGEPLFKEIELLFQELCLFKTREIAHVVFDDNGYLELGIEQSLPGDLLLEEA